MSATYSVSSDPYTHAAHAIRCREATQKRQIPVQYVLAKRGMLVYCAVIKSAYKAPNGPDCWTVETIWPEKTRITVPVHNVLQCGGLTCSCVPFESAWSEAKPDSNGTPAAPSPNPKRG